MCLNLDAELGTRWDKERRMEVRIREGYKQDEKGSVFGECHHSDATSKSGETASGCSPF